MFKFLAKSAIASLIWSKYRNILISTALLFLAYFIISLIHNDYLEYAKVSGDNARVALSYVTKWGALLAVTLIYYSLNIHPKKKAEKILPKSHEMPRRPKSPGVTTEVGSREQDPFAKIRAKQKLQSKAEASLKD